MRRLLSLVAAMVGTIAQSQASGTMLCKVKSVNSVYINEGKPEVSSRSAYLQNGSDLILEFSVNEVSSFFLSLKSTLPDHLFISGFFIQGDMDKEGRTETEIRYHTSLDLLHLDGDYIEFRSSNAELRLQRYYKDDWQGIYQGPIMGAQRFSPLHTEVATLDCRRQKGDFSDTISVLRGD